jgi:DNA invertase Pin-like site-specific DNA recombinase
MEIRLTAEELRRTWVLVSSANRQKPVSSSYFDGMMFGLIFGKVPSEEELQKRREFTRAEFLEGAEATLTILSKDKNYQGGRHLQKIDEKITILCERFLKLQVPLPFIAKRIGVNRSTLWRWIQRGKAILQPTTIEEEYYKRLWEAMQG